MLSEQEKSEIRASYKNAIDPRQHVKILMQLYLCLLYTSDAADE